MSGLFICNYVVLNFVDYVFLCAYVAHGYLIDHVMIHFGEQSLGINSALSIYRFEDDASWVRDLENCVDHLSHLTFTFCC